MNKRVIYVSIAAFLLLFFLAYNALYMVKYSEVAVKTTFGRVSEGSVITEPGLHFRLPFFAEQVKRFDRRLQLVETPLESVATADGQMVVARAFLLWRVDTSSEEATLAFYNSYEDEFDATARLGNRLRDAVQSELAKYSFGQLLGEQNALAEAELAIRDSIASASNDGVEAVTVGISKLMLPPRTSVAVLQRMRATRNLLAEGERHKGDAEANRIQSEASTKADKIRAFAERRANQIRAEGEQLAAQYLQEMSQDTDLAIFLVHLDALERMLSDQTTVILEANAMSPFYLMNPNAATTGTGIPIPPMGLAQASDRVAPRPADVATGSSGQDTRSSSSGEPAESSTETSGEGQ